MPLLGCLVKRCCAIFGCNLEVPATFLQNFNAGWHPTAGRQKQGSHAISVLVVDNFVGTLREFGKDEVDDVGLTLASRIVKN